MPQSAYIDLAESLRALDEAMNRLTQATQAGEAIVPRTEPVTEVIEEGIIPKDDDNCPCEAHKLARFEGSKLRNAVIHEYSFRPRGNWKLKSVGANDPFKYYLGVELETDSHAIVADPNRIGSMRENWSRVTPSIAADMRRPKNLWVPKHDGSVTGPEFASHPATLTYWQKNRKQLEDMFQMLLHAGYRSHDNDTCGMHVNISRTAFADPNHLFRFLTLIHANPKWSLRMSQRSMASANQWANVDVLQDVVTRGRSVLNMVRDRSGEFGRYMSLNAPRGEPRFEFRLPRGTLRIDRFFKNLEWTVGMIEFSREHKVKDCTPPSFMEWARANEGTYPDLVGFLSEKFSFNQRALADAEPVTGNVPEDEAAITDGRETIQIRRGGPTLYRDGLGTLRFVSSERRVHAWDTFTGDDGVERYSMTGNRAPQQHDPGRPQTYTDNYGVERYLGSLAHMTGQRVNITDAYRDRNGDRRYVLSNNLVV